MITITSLYIVFIFYYEVCLQLFHSLVFHIALYCYKVFKFVLRIRKWTMLIKNVAFFLAVNFLPLLAFKNNPNPYEPSYFTSFHYNVLMVFITNLF
jgi:hypothetical protein